jgi:CcmD family protein
MWKRAGWAMVVCVVLALAAVPLAAYQQPAQEAFQTFKPGDGGVEVLPAAPLVFFAYAFVWVVLLAYVYLLWSRLKRVERELATVSSKLGGAPRR